MDGNFSVERKNRKDKLLGYYKSNTNNASTIPSMYDLDSSEFDYNAYIKKIIKEESLSTLMEKEKEMLDKIRSLDSEMQTLVYDNYNKFIYATDTIKNMKSDFKYVENEMSLLGKQMNEVSSIARELQSELNPRREQLKKLSGTHQLLKRLEYLFELPGRLRSSIENKQYLSAVRSHNKAQAVLDRYQDLPSFEGIRKDCDSIISDLQQFLWTKFDCLDIEIQELSSVVMILSHLKEPRIALANKFLSHCFLVLGNAFQSLQDQLQLNNREDINDPFIPDILHFANITSELVLDRLSSQISIYTELFLQEIDGNDFDINSKVNFSATDESELNILLLKYLEDIMPTFLDIVTKRLDLETETGDTTMLARAMDRLHSRLQALNKLVPRMPDNRNAPKVDLAEIGLNMVCKIAQDRCQFYSGLLSRQINECITDIRQRMAASQVGSGGALASLSSSTDTSTQSATDPKLKYKNSLFQLMQSLSDALVDQLKATLNAQQAFIATDNTFSKKAQFQTSFCLHNIRQSLFVGFIEDIIFYCNELTKQTSAGSSSSPLLLILARFCQNWADQGTLNYLLTIVDEQFLITTIKGQDSTIQLTSIDNLATELRRCCLNLTNAYVRIQGNCLSQMIRKSVDTRDWLNCVEPRSVRSVMKRVVEDMSQIDMQVSQLLPSKQKNSGDQSSDSSRRQFGGTSNYNIVPNSAISNPSLGWSFAPSSSHFHSDRFLTNVNKLFAEKIHIFAPVVAVRESVLTGVVRIGLKTFMECVRLKTFGKFGLQQIQVDCRFLQIHLWRFVAEEQLIHTLLEDVISSVIQRCVDPVIMEDSIIEVICEN